MGSCTIGKELKLYLVESLAPSEYDATRSFVVVEEDENEASLRHPAEDGIYKMNKDSLSLQKRMLERFKDDVMNKLGNCFQESLGGWNKKWKDHIKIDWKRYLRAHCDQFFKNKDGTWDDDDDSKENPNSVPYKLDKFWEKYHAALMSYQDGTAEFPSHFYTDYMNNMWVKDYEDIDVTYLAHVPKFTNLKMGQIVCRDHLES